METAPEPDNLNVSSMVKPNGELDLKGFARRLGPEAVASYQAILDGAADTEERQMPVHVYTGGKVPAIIDKIRAFRL